jgi:Rnl2 family RNA ligase
MFKKFPSISNAKQANKCRNICDNWVRQEKIHGSNFQIIIGPTEIKFGSRNNELPPVGEPSDYYDYSEISNDLIEYAKNLRKELGSDINVYGELYGGGKKIQLEIIYSDNLQFRVFDVMVKDKWLPYEKFDIVKNSGFSVVNTLEIGLLDVLLNRTTEFISEYADDGKVNAEGYVVKKITSEGIRYAFKNKAPSFVEKHTNKKITQKEFKFSVDKTENNDELEEYIMSKNRLDALNSKIGPPKLENVNNLSRMLVIDAVKDYCVDNGLDSKEIGRVGFKYFPKTVEFIKESIVGK